LLPGAGWSSHCGSPQMASIASSIGPFCTWLSYNKIFKEAIFTKDFAVYNP